MTKNNSRFSTGRLALAVLLLLTPMVTASAEALVETNSVLGTYLAARLAQNLRDTDAANALLKAALEKDPANASLLEQAFVTEIVGGNWTKAVGYATRSVAAEPGNHLAHLILGVDAFKAGRLAEAEKHFAEPGNTPVAVFARSWVANARKDTTGASALLGSINDPNWLGYFHRLQMAAMADINGDSAGAGKIYDDMFAANPAEFQLALAYARHASHLGDNKQASAILAKYSAAVVQNHPVVDAAVDALNRGETLALDPSTNADGLAKTFFGFSQALEGQGGVDSAMMYNQLALQLKPDDELSLFAQANIFEQIKQYDNAIAAYKKLPATSPLHFDASVRGGVNLDALDRTDEAKAVLQALAEPPKTAGPAPAASRDALHAQIEALANLRPHDKGDKVTALQALLALAGLANGGGDGTYGPATAGSIGQLQKESGLPETGALNAATRKALELKLGLRPVQAPAAKPLPPERLIDLYTTIGNMLRGRKQFAEAASNYTKAIALIGKPSKANWDQYYSRAVCLERLNKWSEAEADFLKAMELNPDEPLILNYLGYSWVDRNEHIDKALELIKKAVSLKPDDGYYVDSLGWAYFRMGRYQDAVEQLERAIELKADDPVINDHLGDAYWRAGRILEAQFQWSTSLSSKPEPEDVPKLQDKLKNGLPAETGASTAAKDSGADKTKLP